MADLSTLDKTLPTDTDPVSDGASRIRETRDAIITSFELEHLANGHHAIPKCLTNVASVAIPALVETTIATGTITISPGSDGTVFVIVQYRDSSGGIPPAGQIYLDGLPASGGPRQSSILFSFFPNVSPGIHTINVKVLSTTLDGFTGIQMAALSL